MVKIGDVVEIAFNRATDEEIAKRPGTYQTEADIGEIVGAPYVDPHGIECAEVTVRGRRRKTPTEKLTVVDRSRLAQFNAYDPSEEAAKRYAYEALARLVAKGELPASVLSNSETGSPV